MTLEEKGVHCKLNSPHERKKYINNYLAIDSTYSETPKNSRVFRADISEVKQHLRLLAHEILLLRDSIDEMHSFCHAAFCQNINLPTSLGVLGKKKI